MIDAFFILFMNTICFKFIFSKVNLQFDPVDFRFKFCHGLNISVLKNVDESEMKFNRFSDCKITVIAAAKCQT